MEGGNGLAGLAEEMVVESAAEMVAVEAPAAVLPAEDAVVESENVAAAAVEGVVSAPGSREDAYLSVEELIAKARAPVKREYIIFNTGPRVMAKSIVMAEKVVADTLEEGTADTATGTVNIVTAKASVDRKSKRQMKRERKEARSNKSAENICGAVAKTGDSKACKYGASCRFNHDLAAFMAQKPADLEGQCPFLGETATCPYGYACRYAGAHPETKGGEITQVLKDGNDDEKNPVSSIREINNLNKSFQKLLWKNAVTFPKADAQLQALGLLGKAKKMNAKLLTTENEIGKKSDSPLDSGLTAPDIGPVCTDMVEDPVKEVPSTIDPETETMVAKPLEEVEEKMRNGNNLTFSSLPNRKDEDQPPAKKTRVSTEDPTSERLVRAKGESHEVVLATGLGQVPHGTGMDDDDSKYASDEVRIPLREKKLVDFRGKSYLAPLTTVGNLPFRRVCKRLGADITCGEMAMCTNLLQGQASEWALLRRHEEEDIFGVQICGSYADTVARAAELIERECTVDFIDLNLGCPIDLVVNKGGGSSLLCKPTRLKEIVKATSATIDTPLTLKLRMGFFEGRNCAHTLIPDLGTWGATAVTIHGRTRQQRYSKSADWDYINQCVSQGPGDIQLIGNGDVFSYTDYNEHLQTGGSKLSTCMIARGALIKPWLFTEIKEQRHWDITAEERLNILRDYVRFGLVHWGSDSKGVETTRHFLLEWLSYAHRYIPVGLLEVVPQKLNWRPPNYFGRNDLETLMASDSAADWVRLTEMVLGPPPAGFVFSPKHKSNAYDKAENG